MPADAPAFPALQPVLVAGEEDVEALLRAARAGIAMLSLQLRSVEGDVAAAERSTPTWDLGPARDLLEVSVDHWLETRRLEMTQELEQARSDAARLVLAARTEAADLVAAASEESLAVLLAGVRHPGAAGAPSLRVVADRPAPSSALDPDPAQRHHPSVRLPLVEPAVLAPAATPTAAPLAGAAALAGVARAATPASVATSVPAVAPELLVVAVPVVEPESVLEAAPLVEVAPVVEAMPVAEAATPAVADVPRPIADAIALAVAAALTDVGLSRTAEPADPAVAPPFVAHQTAAPLPGPVYPPAVISVPETTNVPAVADEPAPEATPRWRQLFFLDVLLPMVAVLVVLIVLLAWVG